MGKKKAKKPVVGITEQLRMAAEMQATLDEEERRHEAERVAEELESLLRRAGKALVKRDSTEGFHCISYSTAEHTEYTTTLVYRARVVAETVKIAALRTPLTGVMIVPELKVLAVAVDASGPEYVWTHLPVEVVAAIDGHAATLATWLVKTAAGNE